MRTSLTVDDETIALVAEMANAHNRTIAGQLRHMVKSHPELIGWKSFKSHRGFQDALAASSGPAKLDR